MPPKRGDSGKEPASTTDTAMNSDVMITGSSSDSSPADNMSVHPMIRIELKCSIMDAQKTIPKFNPGNVGRAEAASTYINWSSKVQRVG